MKIDKDTVIAGLKSTGIYHASVDPAQYHALKLELEQELRMPVISKSTLVDYHEDKYKLNYDRLEGISKSTRAMRAGALLDCVALTPDIAKDCYVVEEVNKRTNAGKARAAEIEEQGKILVSPAEYAEAEKNALLIREAVDHEVGSTEWETQHAIWMRLNTISDYGRDTDLDSPCILTGMLDILPLSTSCPIIDLKTTSARPHHPEEINRVAASYYYGLQAAIYTDLMAAVEGTARPPFTFLFVNTSPPARLAFYRTDWHLLDFFRTFAKKLIADYVHDWKLGNWGNPLAEESKLTIPDWQYKHVENYITGKPDYPAGEALPDQP